VSLSFDLAISEADDLRLGKKSDTEVISFLSVFLAIVEAQFVTGLRTRPGPSCPPYDVAKAHR
jgi:hypothetical protein